MSRFTDTLAQRVVMARKKRGLTQGRLAALAGMRQPDISKIELGLIQQTTGIARLASALSVPVAWLEMNDGPEPMWDAAQRAGEEDAPVYAVAHRMSFQSFETAPPLSWEELMKEDRKGTLPETFIARAPDDAMAPLARAGHEFLFKVGHPVKPGAGVIVRDRHGTLYLRQYTEKRGPGLWEAMALNKAYRSLSSDDDGLEIVAVLRAPMRGWEDI